MPALPLFPLKTVLFPSMPVTLHIFEPRYIKMINECIDERKSFGVVLIRRGRETKGKIVEPHPIGCTARVVQVERLDKGRMNIIAVGEERFRIESIDTDQEYLVGKVEMLPLGMENRQEVLESSEQLKPWIQRYLHILADAKMIEGEIKDLPEDPQDLAYLAAFLLQVPTRQKQALLAVNQAARLIADTRAHYRREVAILNTLLSDGGPKDEGIISLN
ncbi:MAG: LON peptidase substrate-binding domain-containing protein [Anaerolineae bacterium]|nr:LON peptidase substrate-binding domain-containing protein [Anaerolineae bacterium]